MRLIAAGGAGLIPVIAVATIYDPLAEPKDQDFTQGLSKFIGTMMRLLLPLTLGVLVVYIFVIPFNFFQPFQNRDLLIIYNAMLFAIMGLLVGATPISLGGALSTVGLSLAQRYYRSIHPGDLGQPVRLVCDHVPHRYRCNHDQPPDHDRLECDQHFLVGADPHPPVDERCTALERAD